jgi:hypothetical protein
LPEHGPVALDLQGTLDGGGLAPLIHFLAGLQAEGCLTISAGPVAGLLVFEAGRLVGATLGSEQGWPALEAIGLLPGNRRFAFSPAPREFHRNLALDSEELQRQLDRLAQESTRLTAILGSVAAVPESPRAPAAS